VEPDILFVFIFTVEAVDPYDVFPDNVGIVSVDVC
jgi:hypothetical protein